VKKSIKILSIVLGVIAVAIVILFISFIISMKPDKDKMEETKIQAKEYLETNYTGKQFEVYDVLYDNMGNFEFYDYAAKVRDKDTSEEFFVYYNEDLMRMEDSKIIEQQKHFAKYDVSPKVMPYIIEKFGEDTDAKVEYSIAEGKVSIIIRLPREKVDTDKKLFNDLITYLKRDVGLKHADVNMIYTVKDEDDLFNANF